MVADLPWAAGSSLLATLVLLVEGLPLPAPPPPHRGRPAVSPDRLFLKALVIMLVRHLAKVGTLLAVLAEPPPEMRQLRAVLTDEQGRFPARRTWGRRLRAVPNTLPAQIGCLGRPLVALLGPWATGGRAGGPSPSTAPCCAPAAGSGTRRIDRRAWSPTPRSTPRPTGPRAGGTAGSTAGSCTW